MTNQKPQSSEVFRLGVIGTGVAATELYAPALVNNARVRVVACVNRSRVKAERWAQQFEGARVFDTASELAASGACDGVLVSLPIASQPEVILEMLAAGLPVLSEKPVAANSLLASSLITRATALTTRAVRGVPWLVGENFAFMSHLQAVHDWVHSGKLGQLRLVEARQVTQMDAENRYFATAWRANPEHDLGFISDGGVHLARALRICCGLPKVMAVERRAFRSDLPPFDSVCALLDFASGAQGTWVSSFDAFGRVPLLRLHGTEAQAEFWYDRARLTPRRGEPLEVQADDSFRAQFQHFAEVVQRGASSLATPEAALEDLELVERVCACQPRPHADVDHSLQR